LVVKPSAACRNVTNVSVEDIVACVVRDDARHAEVSYINAGGDAITVAFDRIGPANVVRGRPVRDVKSRAGQRNYSGLFWCATTQTHLCYESLLERDRLLLADFDPTVRWVACQPFGYEGLTVRRSGSTYPTFCSSTGMAVTAWST
jgi:hypothetical protein